MGAVVDENKSTNSQVENNNSDGSNNSNDSNKSIDLNYPDIQIPPRDPQKSLKFQKRKRYHILPAAYTKCYSLFIIIFSLFFLGLWYATSIHQNSLEFKFAPPTSGPFEVPDALFGKELLFTIAIKENFHAYGMRKVINFNFLEQYRYFEYESTEQYSNMADVMWSYANINFWVIGSFIFTFIALRMLYVKPEIFVKTLHIAPRYVWWLFFLLSLVPITLLSISLYRNYNAVPIAYAQDVGDLPNWLLQEGLDLVDVIQGLPQLSALDGEGGIDIGEIGSNLLSDLIGIASSPELFNQILGFLGGMISPDFNLVDFLENVVIPQLFPQQTCALFFCNSFFGKASLPFDATIPFINLELKEISFSWGPLMAWYMSIASLIVGLSLPLIVLFSRGVFDEIAFARKKLIKWPPSEEIDIEIEYYSENALKLLESATRSV